MMQWLGWLVALLAIAAALWFVRAWRGEQARANELLYEKMDLENELDTMHAERVANPPPDPMPAAMPAAAVLAPSSESPAVQIALAHLRELGTQIEDYRKCNRAYDLAVQQCLQPLELLIGADAATMASALGHIDKARKPLFAARAAVQKSPLQRAAAALDAACAALADPTEAATDGLTTETAHTAPAP